MTVIQRAMALAKIIAGMNAEILAIGRVKDPVRGVEESAAVVQDVKQHAKAHVNSVVRVEIDINYNSYGKRHFISSRVFQELIQKSITDFSGKRIVITAHTPIRT